MHNGMHTYEQMLQITVNISLRLVFVFSRLFLIWGQLVCTGVNFAFLRILRFLYFLLSLDECHSLPVQSTAWKTVSGITCCVCRVWLERNWLTRPLVESPRSQSQGGGVARNVHDWKKWERIYEEVLLLSSNEKKRKTWRCTLMSSNMFSHLRSRWTMPRWWQYSTASHICLNQTAACGSAMRLYFRTVKSRSPPVASSIMI